MYSLAQAFSPYCSAPWTFHLRKSTQSFFLKKGKLFRLVYTCVFFIFHNITFCIQTSLVPLCRLFISGARAGGRRQNCLSCNYTGIQPILANVLTWLTKLLPPNKSDSQWLMLWLYTSSQITNRRQISRISMLLCTVRYRGKRRYVTSRDVSCPC